MVLLDDEAQEVARFGPFGDSSNLDVDRWTVCAKRTIGSEIISNAPDGILGDKAQVEACFSPFGGRLNLDAR